MKNIFGKNTQLLKGQKGDTGPAGSTTLTGLTDVQLVNPQTNDLFYFDGVKWKSKKINVEDLNNVLFTGLINKQTIIYNSTLGKWVNSYNSLNLLSDVGLTSPLINQGLVYDGATWKNQNIVNSFNSRTGIITSQTGDYSLNQISGVSLTSPQNGQGLIFDGVTWRNQNINSSINQLSGVSISNPIPGQYLQYNISGNWVNAGISKTITLNLMSNGSLANNSYILPVGLTTIEQRARYYLHISVLGNITINLFTATGGGGTRTFNFLKNGSSFFSFTTNNTTRTVFNLAGQYSIPTFNQGDYITCLHTTTNSPTNSDCTIILYLTI